FKEAPSNHTSGGVRRHPINRAQWQLVGNAPEGGNPALATDGHGGTFWLTAGTILPQEFTTDMGRVYTLTGFSYLPRQDGETAGLVSRYALATSMDNITWETVAKGEFA